MRPPFQGLGKACGRRSQRGQAAVEYGIVLALTTIVLIVAAVDPSVIDELIEGLKKFFRAFSWAISVTPQTGP